MYIYSLYTCTYTVYTHVYTCTCTVYTHVHVQFIHMYSLYTCTVYIHVHVQFIHMYSLYTCTAIHCCVYVSQCPTDQLIDYPSHRGVFQTMEKLAAINVMVNTVLY